LNAFNDAGQALHFILNIKEILAFNIQLVPTELKAKRASLMLLNKATNELVTEAAVGLDVRVAQTVRVPLGVLQIYVNTPRYRYFRYSE
jgi:GAF domain-containing protein